MEGLSQRFLLGGGIGFVPDTGRQRQVGLCLGGKGVFCQENPGRFCVVVEEAVYGPILGEFVGW